MPKKKQAYTIKSKDGKKQYEPEQVLEIYTTEKEQVKYLESIQKSLQKSNIIEKGTDPRKGQSKLNWMIELTGNKNKI